MTLQRKYFGTDGIRGRVGESLINPEFVLKLGWAMGKVLGNGSGGKVIIGKDTRISGYMLESALVAGLSAAGMAIRLLGPMPTPSVAYLTRTLRATAGIVISASHNLYHDNGLKLFSHDGFKLPDEAEYNIEQQIDKPLTCEDASHFGKAVRINDAAGRYIEFCKGTYPSYLQLNGLKIVIDCANGATYHIAPKVFRELGADVTEIGVSPDGFNINKDCGATSLSIIQQRVLSEKADLGIAFDGDGDRCLMIDHQGEVVDGDEELFILASDLAARKKLRGGIVGTSMSNLGLEEALQKHNIDFYRTNVGDRYVMIELKKRGWLLGGEGSGHIVNLAMTTTGDGIISALQVLRVIQQQEKSLHELKQGMHKYPQVLINVPIKRRVELSQAPKLQQAVALIEQKLAKQGRVLLRPSGTEPVMRVMVEGRDHDQVSAYAQELADVVQQQ